MKVCRLCNHWRPFTDFGPHRGTLDGRSLRCRECVRKLNAEPQPREQRTATTTVHAALASGRLVRPTECEKCGAARKVQAHHHKGYAAKHRLDVQWLCASCHGFIGQSNRRVELAARIVRKRRNSNASKRLARAWARTHGSVELPAPANALPLKVT